MLPSTARAKIRSLNEDVALDGEGYDVTVQPDARHVAVERPAREMDAFGNARHKIDLRLISHLDRMPGIGGAGFGLIRMRQANDDGPFLFHHEHLAVEAVVAGVHHHFYLGAGGRRRLHNPSHPSDVEKLTLVDPAHPPIPLAFLGSHAFENRFFGGQGCVRIRRAHRGQRQHQRRREDNTGQRGDTTQSIEFPGRATSYGWAARSRAGAWHSPTA